ncbi:MAG: choice-of-anchor B family protein [Rhodothermales bacterium]|nr:choice-of-anchor B family protein [Rhodothermales bacterium]MBO6779118.1 choice-of-anchor B family protein [Rhodothermales bacterium]
MKSVSAWVLSVLFLSAAPLMAQVPDGKGAGPEEQADDRAYKSLSATPCLSGFAGPFPCENVDLLSRLTRAELGGGSARLNDLWGWEDPETGRRYVLQGKEDATAFVDVTDPEAPVYLGLLPLRQGARASVWRDIKVRGEYAFIVADGAGNHGMQVFDLTRLRNVTTPRTFAASTVYEGFGSAHNVVMNEETGFAYAVGTRSGNCPLGLHMIDVSDPVRPVFAGCHQDERFSRGYTHDAQCVVYTGPDATHQGREICIGSNESALSIVDVTDKSQIRQLGVGTYPTSRYVHQGWLSEDHRYFYQNDEGDERVNPRTRTLVWDVTDLDDPTLVLEFNPGPEAIDHNLYTHEGLLYEANYTSGLQVMDIISPEDPVRVAYFDTTPNDSQVSFNGAWTVYPYFSDGTVALSSRSEGLFLLRLTGILVSRLESFQTRVSGDEVAIEWTMRRQKDVTRYEFELVREDGSAEMLASVDGGGDALDRQSFSLVTSALPPGRSQVRLVAVASDGQRRVLLEDELFVVPGTHFVAAPWPNPTGSRARVSLLVANAQDVTVELYDEAGRRVGELHGGFLKPEEELRLDVDVAGLAAGRYWVRFTGLNFTAVQPLFVAR